MEAMAHPLTNEGLCSINGDYHADKYGNGRWNRDSYNLRWVVCVARGIAHYCSDVDVHIICLTPHFCPSLIHTVATKKNDKTDWRWAMAIALSPIVLHCDQFLSHHILIFFPTFSVTSILVSDFACNIHIFCLECHSSKTIAVIVCIQQIST